MITAIILTLVLLILLTGVLIFLLRRKPMQAKFVITFTENPAVPPIALTTTAFTGTVGTAETGSLGPSGGAGGPYVVTVDPTTPPPAGVTIGPDGTISGTPTAPGVSSVNVTVADSQG
jgi:hypothetical protein